MLVEIAAGTQQRADRAEVARADDVPPRSGETFPAGDETFGPHQVGAVVHSRQHAVLRDRHRRDTGHGTHALLELARRDQRAFVHSAGALWCRLEDEQPVGRDTEIDLGQVRKRLQEETGAHHQHERHGDLRGDQHGPEPLRPAGVAAHAQRPGQARTHGLPRRCKAEDNRRGDRRGGNDEEQPSIDGDGNRRPGSVGRDQPQQRFTTEPGHGYAHRSAGAGKQQALGEQLTNEAGTRHPERQPRVDLPAPRCRPGEQQVGDVGARDQEHEDARAHEQQQRPGELRAQPGLTPGRGPEGNRGVVDIAARVFGQVRAEDPGEDLPEERRELGVDPRRDGACRHPADQTEPTSAGTLQQVAAGHHRSPHRQRHP